MVSFALRVVTVLCFLTVPLLVAAVFWKSTYLAAGAFLGLAAVGAFLCLRGLRNGYIDTRNHGRVRRGDSPGVYWLLVGLLGAAAVAAGTVAVLALLGVVGIRQSAPW